MYTKVPSISNTSSSNKTTFKKENQSTRKFRDFSFDRNFPIFLFSD